MSCFEAGIEHRVLGRVGVAAHEIAVVLAFAPTKAHDGGQRLIGIAVLPSCANEGMGLYILMPICKPMQLKLSLPHGCIDA